MLHGIALRYFVEVARTGSLAAASENLHVAVSAISRQISKLEHDVGTALFERMSRGMVLTESGERLAEHARRALLEGDAVLGEIAATKALGGGIVRIGCTEGFAHSFLPQVLAQHHAATPHVRFNVHSGAPTQVEQWVAVGEVDIGLTFSSSDPTKVRIEHIAAAPVCALLNVDHPLARNDFLTLAEMKEYPVVLLEHGNTARHLFDQCCAQHGFRLEPLLTSNNLSSLQAFASLTGAITIGSRLSLGGQLKSSSLVARRVDEPALNERNLCVTTMRERRLSRPVDGVLKALISAIHDAL